MDAQGVAVLFIVIAVVLSAAEVVAPGLVLLPFGLGAGVAAIVGFLGGPPLVQAIVFLIASFSFFLALRPLSRRLNAAEHGSGFGSDRLVGATGTVLEHIARGETGLVRVDREEWRAEAATPDQVLVPGTNVRVLEVRGTRVVVKAEHSGPLGNQGGTRA